MTFKTPGLDLLDGFGHSGFVSFLSNGVIFTVKDVVFQSLGLDLVDGLRDWRIVSIYPQYHPE